MSSTALRNVATTVVLLLAASSARAKEVNFEFYDSSNKEEAEVTLTFSGYDPVKVKIPARCKAAAKRDLILKALSDAGFTAAAKGDAGISMTKLIPGTKVGFDGGKTGEVKDAVLGKGDIIASISFAGGFEPFDSDGRPAVFTAGIVTDVGELTAQVSAEELNFQTEGPIICQALFQRLAPHAPDLGAQVNYAGDRLEVYFDPAYSVNAGGITFGTSSPSPGWSGELQLLGGALPGDLNCDGEVNFGDVNAFVLALTNPDQYAELYPDCPFENRDVNGDGVFNFGDIGPFVQLLGG